LIWRGRVPSKVPKEWITDVEERARLDNVREKGRRRINVEMVRSVFGKEKGKVYVEGAEPVA